MKRKITPARSIAPAVVLVVIIHVSLVHDAIAARRGILAREIPVAAMVWHGRMQVFDRLENNLKLTLPLEVLGADELDDLFGNLLRLELLVDPAHVVLRP